MSEDPENATFDSASIEALPDYAALKQVKDALWKLGDVHGAAVMIGAGFSRFAKLAAANTPPPPLWSDFSKAMLADLYPSGGGPTDPLVLAEEYRSALGHGALEGIIRKHVRDTEWEPGDVHGNLLRLPWADVLTTNWDTLLERSAASDPDTCYDVVRVTADIARARRPRIVKLHGSMPAHLPFVFTEEDFRTYPEHFAPFVNLAQQALLENELCLLGFSGEDPNFLKWAGWVRDKLGNAARPIRLVGVLNLSPSRRRLFETRNITPIDLSPLVKDLPADDRHETATELLLEYLWQARPSTNIKWKWAEEKESGLGSATSPEERVTLLTNVWRQDRERHPGWLVTPYFQRFRSRMNMHDAFQVLEVDLPKVSPKTRAAMLFEAVWRWNTLFWSLPPTFEDLAENALSSEEDVDLSEEQRTLLHVAMVRTARQRRDWSAFDTRLGRLGALSGEGAKCGHAYEACLRARDELNYSFILENAHRVDGHDPIWGLRRAALLAEILETEAAARSIQLAYRELRRRRAQDRRSLWLLSREAWASFMMRSAWFELKSAEQSRERSDWPLAYKAADTDPWDELNAQGNELEKTDERRRADAVEKRPLFDPGRYQINSGNRYVSNAVSDPLEQLTFLSEHVGLPLRLGNVEVTGRRSAAAISCVDDDNVSWLALRSIISHDYELLEEHFSRLAIATLPRPDVDRMVDCLGEAIAFGRTQMAREQDNANAWANKIKIMCELLSRLCVRLDGDRAISCFKLGASLLSDPSIRHWWILKGISSLLTRSIQALQPARRQEIALEVLRLPLPNEAKFRGLERDFPEVSELLDVDVWKAREDGYNWNSRIAHLLDQSKGDEPESRRHAIFRLLPLFEAGVLTKEESDEFGDGLWSGTETHIPASDTNLLPHVFLRLPAPDPAKPKLLFSDLIQKIADGSYDPDLLASLHSASYTLEHEYCLYGLEPSVSERILESLLRWRPTTVETKARFDFHTDENARIENNISRLLASTILPNVSSDALNQQVCDAIFARIADGSIPSLLIALPALTQRVSMEAERAHKAIRAGLLGGQSVSVHAALYAIFLLARQQGTGGGSVPRTLVSEVVTLCFMRREPGLVAALSLAVELVKSDAVSEGERNRLSEGLELIRLETAYTNWEDQSRMSDVGLIRRAAVQLCQALKDAGETDAVLDDWLSEAPTDPMPEVRYALSEK